MMACGLNPWLVGLMPVSLGSRACRLAYFYQPPGGVFSLFNFLTILLKVVVPPTSLRDGELGRLNACCLKIGAWDLLTIIFLLGL